MVRNGSLHLLKNYKEMGYEELLESMCENQRNYVIAYNGSPSDTCRVLELNWKTVRNYPCLSHVRRALTLRARYEEMPDLIATRQERQMLWTDIMRDSEAEKELRLKASQLLGKSEADFIDKKIIEGGDRPIGHVVGHADIQERIELLEQESVYDITAEVVEDEDDLDFLR